MDRKDYITPLSFVEDVPDPRKAKGKRYEWRMLLALILGALVSGRKSMVEIADWSSKHGQEVLAALGSGSKRVPSCSTLRRVVQYLDVEKLERQLAAYGQAVDAREGNQGSVVGVDGQVLRGQAVDGKEVRGVRAHGENVVMLTRRVSHSSGITLGQIRVANKTNEITASPQLLAGYNLQGTVTTMDALLTQRKLAEQIVRQGGDYLMVVKLNQRLLWDDIDLLFCEPPFLRGEEDCLTYQYSGKEHGRLETRTITTSAFLAQWVEWPHVAQIARRVCRRILDDGKIQQEVTYALTSLPRSRALPQHLEALWRGHWTIENRVHYPLDFSMGEDACQVHAGAAPQVLAALRLVILTALRHHGWLCVPAAFRHLGNDTATALALIGALAT